jgi:transcriptional regulator with XRE-family HTH domain
MSRRPAGTAPYHPINIYIGQRLRERRVALGMSQTALGNRLGISFQQIQKYEKGVNALSPDRLIEVAQALDVHFTYFFDGYDSTMASVEKVADARGEGRLLLKLMQLLKEIPTHQRAPLMHLIMAMARHSGKDAGIGILLQDTARLKEGSRLSR